MACRHDDLKTPGAGTREHELRDVDTLHVGRLAVHVPRAVGMDVDPLALFDDLKAEVTSRRFGDGRLRSSMQLALTVIAMLGILIIAGCGRTVNRTAERKIRENARACEFRTSRSSVRAPIDDKPALPGFLQ